ncbi:hypothetical protein BJ912DRAFT_925648 [Pholiota molesta]|nr:hypothetical protein BJ912DRAFT_925648 [Pholiota molesta]
MSSALRHHPSFSPASTPSSMRALRGVIIVKQQSKAGAPRVGGAQVHPLSDRQAPSAGSDMHGPPSPAHSFRPAPPTLSLPSNAGLRPSRPKPKRKKAAATHRYHPAPPIPIPLLIERIPPRLRLRLPILVLLQPAPIKGHRPPIRLPRVLLLLREWWEELRAQKMQSVSPSYKWKAAPNACRGGARGNAVQARRVLASSSAVRPSGVKYYEVLRYPRGGRCAGAGCTEHANDQERSGTVKASRTDRQQRPSPSGGWNEMEWKATNKPPNHKGEYTDSEEAPDCARD